MKIAYISDRCFSDVDLSYLSEAQAIMDITYFVPIFRNRLKGAAFDLKQIYAKYGIFEAIDVYPELSKFSRLINPSKFFVVNSKALHMWNLRNLWLYVNFVWKLRNFDVIHLTDFPYYYEWFLYFLRKKIVLTLHDPIPHSSERHNSPMILLNRKIGFRFINHFVMLNKAQIDECININNLHNKNIYESRLGRYDYLRIYETNNVNTCKYILYFGQIFSYKGLDYLLPSMVELHKTHPDVKLIIAGKGEFHFDISVYEKMNYIEFRNRFIPDEELSILIQGAQFVVCPYKDATQSGVIMSAYAFNKPVLATNVGGLPEMVIDGVLGKIIPPCDISELVKSMRYLIDNVQLLNQYSYNIKKEYLEGLKSWKQISIELKRVYEDICLKSI